MATKVNAPNPALFDSDPLEQIFAKGMYAPNMAGLSYLMMKVMQGNREDAAQEYLGGIDRANEVQRMISRMEEEAKIRTEGVKGATQLAKEGYLPSTLRGGGDLFHDPAKGDEVARMLLAIAQQKAASSGGSGVKDQVTEQRTVFQRGPDGQMYPVTITSRSANPAIASQNADASMKGRNILQPNSKDPMTNELIRRHQENQRYPIRD